MRRGISLGGALDADPGRGLRPGGRHFDVVRDAGFDTVRLPVRWSAHVGADSRIDPGFLDLVDRTVAAALARELEVVLNVHHLGAPDALPGLWAQIAPRFADADARVRFELLNEPHPPLTAEGWNRLLPAALAVVRESNPGRAVIVGPACWNIVDALPGLRLPDDDQLIVTVHYYSPFRFTHQGAAWLEGAGGWLGTGWGGEADRARVRADLERAAAWADAAGRPLLLGEFGAIDRAPAADRAAWTACVRAEAERLGLAWSYWDLATDFGAYDLARAAWRAPLRDALLG